MIFIIIMQWNLGDSVTNGPKKLAVLRGDRISEGFFTRKCLAGWPKKSVRNNEVTVLPRWPWGGVPLYTIKPLLSSPGGLYISSPMRLGGDKLKYKKVGVHAAEDQNQIQPSSWKINHPRSVHTKFYSCD